MPGDNCSVVLCGKSRREAGQGIFQVPGKKCKKKDKWRAEFLNAITKTRVVDQDFREIIDNDRVFAYHRHFKESEIKIRKFSWKHLTKI